MNEQDRQDLNEQDHQELEEKELQDSNQQELIEQEINEQELSEQELSEQDLQEQNSDEQELQDLELEDIIKEFSVAPAEESGKTPEAMVNDEAPEEDAEELSVYEPESKPELATQTVDLQETRRMEPVSEQVEDSAMAGDTVRLDGLLGSIPERNNKRVDAVRIEEEKLEDTIRAEPYSDQWEPEYEQPIGNYVPPQPIQFPPKSRLRELKRKLVAGPEKRFYQLAEKGVGKLQFAIFLSLLVVLGCAVSTVLYAMGLVQESRMRLMVFGQFLSLLISALLGSFQMIEGVADLIRKRFTLNTLLVITFVVCCVDGVLCLQQLRVPCCAAFGLEVTMSLWSTYHRRSTEIAQMDTMRKATRRDGVAVCTDYLDDKKGLLRKEGQVEDFMDRYAETGKPEKMLHIYAMIALVSAFCTGVIAAVLRGSLADPMGCVSIGVQVTAVSLLAAMPATAFISQSRPAWILERRLHKLGTVLCGWNGVEGLSGKAVFPVTFQDLYPMETLRMNGMKFFGDREPEQVMEYAAAVILAEGGGLAGLFDQLLFSHNARHFAVDALCYYENGGVGGTVDGVEVLVGSAAFLKDREITVPDNAKLHYAVYVAIAGELSGLFAVSYEKTKSAAAGLTTLNAYRKLQCALITDDFMLTPGFLRGKFGVKPKRFLFPEHEVRQQLREKMPQEDAPALLLTTSTGLAPVAYGVTGARVLKTTSRLGAVLHIVGGGIGIAIMLLLVVLGALELLVPVNMFLYQLVWLIPALLITEWTRSI